MIIRNISKRIRQSTGEINDNDLNTNICARLPQIREYPSLFAFILMICRIVERQHIRDEFDNYGKLRNKVH